MSAFIDRLAILRSKIEERSIPEPNSGCWLWLGTAGGHTPWIYGRILDGKTWLRAHRASYEAFVGEIPEGWLVCHKCDNTMCVNPLHLYAGSHTDNMRDAGDRGRNGMQRHPDKSFVANNSASLRRASGNRHWNVKIPQEAIPEIRASTGSHRQVAERYGVKANVIYNIRRGVARKACP